MSDNTLLFLAEHYDDIDRMIDAALARYKPDLSAATGELSATRYPTPTGNAPGGYTPALHAASHESGGGDPLDLGSIAGTLTDSQHGSRAGGSLHATATGSVAGFLSAADKTKLDSIASGASVSSVGLSAPSQFSVSGSPVTGAGTLALAWQTQSANTVLSGPATGAAAAPTFRTLVAADIPSLDAAKITTGEIPRSPLTTRGDLLTRDATTHVRVAIGAAGRYLRSDGTDPSWHTLDFADLTYSGLTAGQVLRATGASAAAFGALDLANSSAVTGVLPAASGGTGVNNSTRTLTISTNGGTLAFSAAASTLTIPASGTAVLGTGANTQIAYWSGTNTLTGDSAFVWDATNKRLGINVTPSVALDILSEASAEQYFTGYFDSGAVGMTFRRAKGTLASPTTIGASQTMGFFAGRGYASTAAAFYRGGQISFEVDGTPTNAGDIPGRIVFYTHATGATNDAVVARMSVFNDGNVAIGSTTNTGNLLYLSSGTSVALRIDGSGNTATTATGGAQTLPANPVGFLIVNIAGTARKLPYYAT